MSVAAAPSLPATGFLRLPQVLAIYPVGKTTWYEGVKSGRYPPSVAIGKRAKGWRVEDIRELIANGPKPDACSTVGARPRHAWLASRPTAPKVMPGSSRSQREAEASLQK